MNTSSRTHRIGGPERESAHSRLQVRLPPQRRAAVDVRGVRVPHLFDVRVFVDSWPADVEIEFEVTAEDSIVPIGVRALARPGEAAHSVIVLQRLLLKLQPMSFYAKRGQLLAAQLLAEKRLGHAEPFADLDPSKVVGEGLKDLMWPTIESASQAIEPSPASSPHDDAQPVEVPISNVRERRHRAVDDEFLTRVTRVYNDAVTAGRSPMRALQAAEGPCSLSSANRWAIEARERGFDLLIPPRSKRNTTHPGKETT